jgi:hypothetical protein
MAPDTARQRVPEGRMQPAGVICALPLEGGIAYKATVTPPRALKLAIHTVLLRVVA